MRKKREKPKRKAQGSSLQIVTPLSLWMSIEALETLGNSYTVRVQYDRVDQESYKFSIRQKYTNAKGHLTKQVDGSTLVVCKSDVNLGMIVNTIIVVVILIALISFVVFTGAYGGNLLLFLGGGLAIMIFSFYSHYAERDKLLNSIQQVLDV